MTKKETDQNSIILTGIHWGFIKQPTQIILLNKNDVKFNTTKKSSPK